ncbi:unnamed protein product [Spirodela intermedia]|uniref:Uncharacterized protein n=1 Tax=Spirodela intermedia TaxID=51605 RepID=A0A7I8IMV1_SPIIN|nr:unnamed protein product [Spirodela intermedia]CAA6658477.1 unnamed protein product [Spirodela intermedia]
MSSGPEAERWRVAAIAVAIFCFWSAAAAAEYPKYKDPKQPLNVRLNDLLSRMTLEEKIGQMAQIERSIASPEVMKKYFVGSVLSGGGSVPVEKASVGDWVKLVAGLQEGALSTRLGIPMLYGIDAVHGHNNVYKATVFPHNIGLGATRDPELVKRIGAATALEVRATGIPYVFAPCVAVCRDPRWGRCYESFSEDPKIVQAMTAVISGLQGDIPANSRKGVPFNQGRRLRQALRRRRGTEKGINENNTIIDFHGLLGIHMPPYYNAVARGVSTVMVSFSSWNGVKMHANRFLITDFLKNRLRFRGFVITDWQGLDRITSPPRKNYTFSLQTGILAGVDMVLSLSLSLSLSVDIYVYMTLIRAGGFIPISRIDDAVRRILRVKLSMGLFENPFPEPSLGDQLGKQEHRDLAREAVRKSLVLLKNGKPGAEPLLPLPKKAPRILVAGSHADNLGYQCGGWTITWQGLSGNNHTLGTTILAGVKKAVDPATEVVYSENPAADFVENGGFSFAVVVVGEHPYAEGDGDSTNLTLASPGPETIRCVCEHVKCVVVVVSGRPVVVEPYLAGVDALVAAWLPGTEGAGVADVLFGDHGFSGKLGRTWFRSVDQLPMNVGDTHYDPLFPFGYGLTTEPCRT